MAEIERLCPASFGRFHEPFVGGGAVFFRLRPTRATLSDQNARLVRTYQGLRDDVDEVVTRLRLYEREHGKELFLWLRQAPVDEWDAPAVAAWMIYLNKTGFNGLYRVNSRDRFNVPFGRHVRPNICDEVNLRACSAALRGVRIEREDFEVAAARAKKGDFVYFDPPYVPLSDTASFRSYTAGGFGPDDQVRLRDVALALKKRGVHVLLSNSSAEEVFRLYSKGFELTRVAARRSVNSQAAGRGAIDELLIR
jgi:DNA adenine methylase